MSIHKSTLGLGEVNGFSALLKAYSAADPKLRHLYDFSPSATGFAEVLKQKPLFANTDRVLLASVLEAQYVKQGLNPGMATAANIQLLKKETTYTVCTGHQLCLFTGPLYFIYKIISTLNLCEELKKNHPDFDFVPVYWMATEDHDFEEVNHARLFGKTLTWNPEQGIGMACGRMSTDTLGPVLAELKSVLGTSEAATGVFQMVEQAYADQKNLAMATRAFVHGLLGHFGLVILDPDEVSLKQRFVPTMEMDLVQSPSQALVDTGIAALAALGYEAQVKPREINLFYMHESVRARIEKSADGMEYTVVGTALRFPATEMLVELKSHPERFSPNVVLRPLYQQQILPNIAYVGGPGELAYWLEYKALFEAYKTFFPVLVPRNFVMWIDAATNSKMNKFALSVSDLSRSLPELEKEFMQGKMGAEVKLEEEGNAMQQLYQDIIRKVSTTDATLKALAEAELQKALNGLKTMEAKMARAEKQKHETALAQIKTLKEKLFPGGTLQERADNFLPLYLKHGVSFLETLKSNLDPFQNDLIVLREQD